MLWKRVLEKYHGIRYFDFPQRNFSQTASASLDAVPQKTQPTSNDNIHVHYLLLGGPVTDCFWTTVLIIESCTTSVK